MPHVDLAFRLTGATIPVDHGYALYAAISRLLPDLHADKDIGIHPVRGRYVGDGSLHLATFSRLTIRLPDDRIRAVLKLAGKTLEVDGQRLRVGVPETRALRPTAALYSRLASISTPRQRLTAEGRDDSQRGPVGSMFVSDIEYGKDLLMRSQPVLSLAEEFRDRREPRRGGAPSCLVGTPPAGDDLGGSTISVTFVGPSIV